MYINILYSFENNIYNWVLEYCIDCAFPTMPWHVLVTYNLHFDGRIGRRKGQRGGVEGFFVPSGRDKRKMGGLQYTMLYIHVHTSVQAEVCIYLKQQRRGCRTWRVCLCFKYAITSEGTTSSVTVHLYNCTQQRLRTPKQGKSLCALKTCSSSKW